MKAQTLIAAALAVLVALILSFLGGSHIGKKLERQVWQKERIVMLAQHAKDIGDQFNKHDQQVKLNDAKARKAADTYENAIDQITKHAAADIAAVKRAGGLRIAAPPPHACRLAATAEGPGAVESHEEAASTVRLPQPVEDGLFGIAADADQVSEQLRALQAWIRDNGHYGQAE
jgi:hypothetical protein